MDLPGVTQSRKPMGHGGKPLQEDARSLRLFLLKVGLFVSVWGALFFKGAWVRYGYWEAGWGLVLGLGLLFPAPFRPLRRMVIRLGSLIGQALSWSALAFIYFLALVPVALVARLTGKKFMPRGKDPAAATYWEPRTESATDRASLERQY